MLFYLTRLLKTLLVAVAALVVLLEEWLWGVISAALARLARYRLAQAVSRVLRSFPPWAALAVLVLPAAVLLPFKMLGLWAVAHGHAFLGIGCVLGAKVTGTAVAAYLYANVREAARKVAWFESAVGLVSRVVNWAHTWLETQPSYRHIRARLRDITDALHARLNRRSARRGLPGWLRLIRAAVRLARARAKTSRRALP